MLRRAELRRLVYEVVRIYAVFAFCLADYLLPAVDEEGGPERIVHHLHTGTAATARRHVHVHYERNAVFAGERQCLARKLVQFPVQPLRKPLPVARLTFPFVAERIHLATCDRGSPLLQRSEIFIAYGNLRKHDAANLRTTRDVVRVSAFESGHFPPPSSDWP